MVTKIASNQFCLQEVGTLPRGPRESSNTWYANARLAFGTLVFFVWGQNMRATGTWTSCLSRCLEKGALYSIACLKHIMSLIDLTNVTDVTFWSNV